MYVIQRVACMLSKGLHVCYRQGLVYVKVARSITEVSYLEEIIFSLSLIPYLIPNKNQQQKENKGNRTFKKTGEL